MQTTQGTVGWERGAGQRVLTKHKSSQLYLNGKPMKFALNGYGEGRGGWNSVFLCQSLRNTSLTCESEKLLFPCRLICLWWVFAVRRGTRNFVKIFYFSFGQKSSFPHSQTLRLQACIYLNALQIWYVVSHWITSLNLHGCGSEIIISTNGH